MCGIELSPDEDELLDLIWDAAAPELAAKDTPPPSPKQMARYEARARRARRLIPIVRARILAENPAWPLYKPAEPAEPGQQPSVHSRPPSPARSVDPGQ